MPPQIKPRMPPRATTHTPQEQPCMPPVNRMTNWCKNNTLPQTSFAGGNDINDKRPFPVHEQSCYRPILLKMQNDSLFLPSATKLRRLCFYTCLSVILFTGEGGLPQCMLGYHPLSGHPRRTRQTPETRHPPEQTSPQQQMATVADCMHPTGMHSFFKLILLTCSQHHHFLDIYLNKNAFQ